MPNKLNLKSTNCQHKTKFLLNNGKKIAFQSAVFYQSITFLLFWLSYQGSVRGQILPDGTVSTEVDNTSQNTTEITGGTTKGANLFHSFQEFSVPTDNTAYFNNASEIENIVGRVTGDSVSNIDGLLQANGNANLILINSNGINFGSNARLQIGGSFLGSTAKSVIFEDGTIFSTNDLTTSPLLTVTTPIGLQLGQNSGGINIEGTGHNLGIDVPIFSPFNRREVLGLKLQSGGTFGLVGGDISLTGGVITSEQGRVELGSVAEGTVAIDWLADKFSLNYEEIVTFKNIDLKQESLVDASGNNSGSINIQANEIAIADGSAVLIQNQGEAASGNLEVNAATSFSLSGVSEDGIIASGIYTEALGGGRGGDISVITPDLEILSGASIFTDTFSAARSGDINLDIANSIELVGFDRANPNLFSLISAQTYNTGDAGAINITTNNFTALNGGNVASITASPDTTGSGGNVTVNSESIFLSGINPFAFAPSQITAGSGSAGNAGNVELNTKTLTLQDGGRVDASATATGDAGNVTVNASESVTVTGTVPDSRNPSLIIASANILDRELREQFNLPNVPSGNSGSVNIATPQLQIMDGGQVTVRNDGTGDAGNLEISANTIDLSDNGGITAAVKEGAGGTIGLNVTDSINLTSGSQISSENNGAGNGGEIAIASNTLNISDRAFITTTTFSSGRGGNIVLDIDEAINITGTGFAEFQQTFQANSLNGNLRAETTGTGIFIGVAANGVGGNLQIDTDTLNLSQGGIIFSPIFADGIGGNIQISGTKDINISGSALQISAGRESTSNAEAGTILLDTQRLSISDGGTIVNATFGEATGGDINISASESIRLQNTPDNSRLFTGIYANTSIGSGEGGNVTLEASNLSIDDAFVSSTTGGFIDDSGNLVIEGGADGGDINITVTDKLEILGTNNDLRFASGINSSSFTRGNAGNITISANSLSIRDGSEIAATTIGSGDGGNIDLSIIDSIELYGTTTTNGMKKGGLIATSGRIAFPNVATGASGDITINTGSLNIEDAASIDVQSLGTGSAGELKIESEGDILLDNEGTISAANNSGNGGNINILANNIFWRGSSTTTATATGNANGGNISIIGNNLVVLESSMLTAEAERGMGGRIDIDAKGLFVCQECIISASSILGVDGIVEIDTLEPEPDFGLTEVPIELTQPEETVARACSNSPDTNNSKLTIVGRGGLPPSPNRTLNSQSIISFGIPKQERPVTTKSQQNILPSPARSWYQNNKGEIILTAQPSSNTPRFNSPNCHVR